MPCRAQGIKKSLSSRNLQCTPPFSTSQGTFGKWTITGQQYISRIVLKHHVFTTSNQTTSITARSQTMIYINTYGNTVESIDDGADPLITDSVQLGFLPGRCYPGREYKGSLESLPFYYRKPIRFERDPFGDYYPIRWIHEPNDGIDWCGLCCTRHSVWPRPNTCAAYQYK